MGKIVDCVCIQTCAAGKDYYERTKIYRIDLSTHPCSKYFKPLDQIKDPANPGDLPSPEAGMSHAERQERREVATQAPQEPEEN
jgi:hypothetical protein